MSRHNTAGLPAVVAAHLVPLRRAAYRLCRNATDADDLVQDVCLRALEKLADLGSARSPRAWLLRVQFNLFVDGRRREARVVTASIDDPHAAMPELRGDRACEPDTRTDALLAAESLNRAWPALTRDQQALLALYAEGYTLRELIEITDLPQSALKARLHRARVRLGNLLQADVRATARTAAGGGDRL